MASPKKEDDQDRKILDKVGRLKKRPGVYLMKDAEGSVLYVGKAKDLRARVRSYFRSDDSRAKVRFLLARLDDIDTIVTDTEKEALLLENNLIKEYRPKYNVNFRDDKTYVHVQVDTNHPFPTLRTVRGPRMRPGVLHFGPYASKAAVDELLSFIMQVFPLRRCKDWNFRTRSRPCLNHQMGRCAGACMGLIDEESYRVRLEGALKILRGRRTELIGDLENRMRKEAAAMRFEEAAEIRNRIRAIESSLEEQKVFSTKFGDQDIFAVVMEAGFGEAAVFAVREGKLLRMIPVSLRRTHQSEAECMGSFVKQYYERADFIPPEVLIPAFFEDMHLVEEVLTERRGTRVRMIVPKRGERARLVKMAHENVKLDFEERKRSAAEIEPVLASTARRLMLGKPPRRIECFDISTLQGDWAVGTMAAFTDGEPDRQQYRKYRIRMTAENNDYAMIAEVLGRRYRRAVEGGGLPDLVVIDGGRGHLNIGLSVLQGLGLDHLDVVSIAKEHSGRGDEEKTGDRIYIPGRVNPIPVGNKKALTIIARIRDEAHRTAVRYHRLLRSRGLTYSVLDDVQGVGPVLKKKLLERFGSVRGIGQADEKALLEIRGVTQDLALRILEAVAFSD